MAKQIKAIKCPSCGSVSKIELKPDYYRCESCQTEYFLDNDDININYKHTYQKTASNPNTKKTLVILLVAFVGVMVIVTVFNSIFNKPKTQPNTNSSYTAPVIEKEKDDQSFRATRYTSYVFLQPSSQKIMALILENRRYNAQKNKNKDGTYLAVYDPLEKKLVKEEFVSEKSLSFLGFPIRRFSDDNLYFINDKTSLLKFDKERLTTEDVGNQFFDEKDELHIGVATMEYLPEGRGDGLLILTNDGKKLYYFPLIQKLYTEKQYYKAYEGFNTLLPNATSKTIHTFTSESYDFPEEKIQLMQVSYKDNGPGPKEIPTRLSWGKDYGRSGIFYGNEPYEKLLLTKYSKEARRVTKLKDLTPDRLYFFPSILLDDGEALVIQFRVNANSNSDLKFQQINRETGEVMWTSEIPEGKAFQFMIKYKDGFLGINRDQNMIVVDNKGNIISNYKIE